MVLNLSLRELVGPNIPLLVGPFGELEAGVINTTILRLGAGIFADAVDVTMPFDGVIVGMVGASEAGSNFTVDVTVNATPDTTTTMTVNSAKEVLMFKPSEFVSFSAGDIVGMEATAVTTGKDFSGYLLVVLDVLSP